MMSDHNQDNQLVVARPDVSIPSHSKVKVKKIGFTALFSQVIFSFTIYVHVYELCTGILIGFLEFLCKKFWTL